MSIRGVIAAGIVAMWMMSQVTYASELPERLDRAMISESIGKVKADVKACGEKSTAKGTVKASVKVNPDGAVGSVSITSTPEPALGDCVAAVMVKASFPQTKQGGSFSYPFVF